MIVVLIPVALARGDGGDWYLTGDNDVSGSFGDYCGPSNGQGVGSGDIGSVNDGGGNRCDGKHGEGDSGDESVSGLRVLTVVVVIIMVIRSLYYSSSGS